MNRNRGLFVNLPVKNLSVSVDFFTKLGFEFDSRFTDESAACMKIGENSYVMLLIEAFFKSFTKKDISDTGKSTEVILAVSADSREEVDKLVNNALVSGGKHSNDPVDQGWMYGRSFQDPDGHLWEVIYMDQSAFAG